MLANKNAVSKLTHDCVLKRGGIKPFRRCPDCELKSVSQCPPVRASFLLLLALAVEAALAWWIGGPVFETIFIVTALASVIIFSIINTQTNEQERNRHRLLQFHREQAEQQEFLRKLSPLESLEDCLQYVVDEAADRLRCDRVSIMLADEEGTHLFIAASRGVPQEVVDRTRIPIGSRIAGRVFNSDTPIHLRGALEPDEALPTESDAFMSAPLLLSTLSWGKVRLGVLSVTEPAGRDDFSVEDEFIFSNICQAASVAIHNQQTIEEVKRNNVEFLEALINALEARDPSTRGHSERVARYAEAIGKRLSLNAQDMDHLSMAGRLHDIGKIAMTDEILLKKSEPSEAEWERIRRHPDSGADMLASASLLSGVLAAIRCHHERLDGSGYPKGLVGDNIPLLARIIGVADAFDAMTSQRPYCQAVSASDALSELLGGAGQKFDLACVEALSEAVGAGELADVLPAEAPQPEPATAASE